MNKNNVAIVCEGKDDVKFLEKLITHLKFESSEVRFFIVGGKSSILDKNHSEYKTLIVEVNAEKIDQVLFVVDADYEYPNKNNPNERNKFNGYSNTERELKTIIKALGIEKISSIYIMCDPETKEGYLESFILSTIPEQQRHCIERFLYCSQFKSKDNHKAILNQIYTIAYPNAPYDFAHPHFEELKNTLQNLFYTDTSMN